jgi:hypothetical protein
MTLINKESPVFTHQLRSSGMYALSVFLCGARIMRFSVVFVIFAAVIICFLGVHVRLQLWMSEWIFKR